MWVVLMQRWGEAEGHHYLLGVYSSKDYAKYAGDVEKSWRGGKYSPFIQQFSMDEEIPEEYVVKYHEACNPN